MELIEAKQLVEAAFSDQALLDLYAEGDKLSHSQTKHDVTHAIQVRDVAIELTKEIDRRLPGKLDEWTREVVIPLAAFLHDIGRAIDVDNHAIAGAKWANAYLKSKGYPQRIVRRVCKIIACHRSSVVLNREFNDMAWAIVVIADKAVGDEDRVRPEPLKQLRRLRRQRKVSAWKGSIHDRVNYAIKASELIVDGRDLMDGGQDPGVIVLRLRIDPVVCCPADIYGLYFDRLHACGRAAQYLGFLFRLEFNGVRYMYSKELNNWTPVNPIKVSGRSR